MVWYGMLWDPNECRTEACQNLEIVQNFVNILISDDVAQVSGYLPGIFHC
jgi:hypothetical protein